MNFQAPRIGIPYRSASEQAENREEKIRPYVEAVEAAGGDVQLISLLEPGKLAQLAGELDGFVFPGSPADVNPALYGETAGPATQQPDRQREETDMALLQHAFEKGKPVLTICYGTQLLNVFRGGTLVQDIPSEQPSSLTHRWDHKRGAPEPHHPARFLPGSLVARLAETGETVVNSSHHQSIRRPGRGLRVTGSAPDGVVESVELEDPSHWVIGVQWHPERQRREGSAQNDSGIRLAKTLFEELVRVAARPRPGGLPATAEIPGNLEGR
ncbi:MAG TPA: gamma-glutamyl-gamma-aminobutyrate hydrolase family protein [Patescibacteria group bacterium]|nr:gamma-glutamyl-gamma-aminobutyrate hydrolase family protein [Patescibacteria group bacterium]